jgi:hypothetical protein
MKHVCSCGAKVRWEKRETWRGARWLGVCINASCGRWTTSLADGEESQDTLAEFLLGGVPAPPDTPPQLRLFLRHAGLGWRHHHRGCDTCNRRLVMALDLVELPDRSADPARVEICLDCGSVVAHTWMLGELHALHLPAESWIEPATTILILKSALEARGTGVSPDWGLGFS